MTRSLSKSNSHFQKAVKRLPLGVSSNFRYWGDDKTIYAAKGRGARLTDIDGNEYIDYRMAYGPCILGYADPRVDEAARSGMEIGGVFALSTEREYAVAERISRMVPAAELVRFSNSGTEAVMAALRLRLLRRHFQYTRSRRAENVLRKWDDLTVKFVKVMPSDYKRALSDRIKAGSGNG